MTLEVDGNITPENGHKLREIEEMLHCPERRHRIVELLEILNLK